jgi:hypothetical protein
MHVVVGQFDRSGPMGTTDRLGVSLGKPHSMAYSLAASGLVPSEKVSGDREAGVQDEQKGYLGADFLGMV